MLGRDDVEVSFTDPAALRDAARRDAALELLTPDERETVGRFRFERDRLIHLAARALVRRSLSRCGDVDPRAWRFAATPYGRPEITAPAATRLRFNTSHTVGLAMVAVVLDRDVGVDVERVPAALPADVVDSSFCEVERAALRAAPAHERAALFTELWTLKEAYAKARGLGLSLALDSFAFALGPPRLVAGDDPAEWHVLTMSPTAAHRASVCVRVGLHQSLRVRTRQDDP